VNEVGFTPCCCADPAKRTWISLPNASMARLSTAVLWIPNLCGALDNFSRIVVIITVAGAGYQRQQGGIQLEDIMRLNEQMNGGKGSPGGTSPSGGSPKPGPRGRARRNGATAANADIASAAVAGSARPPSGRRGVVTAVPALDLGEADAEEKENENTSDDGGEGEISPGKGVTFASQSKRRSGKFGRESDANGSEGGSEGDGNSEGDDENENEDSPHKQADWDTADHASMKYSTKYKDYQLSATAVLPDYIREVIANNFSTKSGTKSAKV
jgi:hypothetical protein